MMKPLVRKMATLATILAILSNIFIFTYPSIHPTRCSWKCSNNLNNIHVEKNIVANELSLWSKSMFYFKRYINDILEQFNSSNTIETDDPNNDDQIHLLAFGDPQIKGVWKNTPYRTRLDIFGNDFYLGHIYSMMQKRLHPSHVVVLGDLFSSQWIPDDEFFNRTKRYMTRIFDRKSPNLTEIQSQNHDDIGLYRADWKLWGEQFELLNKTQKFEFGYNDVYSWDPENEDFLFINVTGNHDTGYSGDVTYQHLTRFQEFFGKDNYWIEYNNNDNNDNNDENNEKAWRLVVLNDLLLEGPALQPEFVDYTWEFLYQLFERKFNGSTILLTHVPFYKKEGLCYDGPEFNYYPSGFEREPYKSGLLRSQNHISEEITNRVLNLIFSNDKPGIILVGHDHVGCEVTYNKNSNGGKWVATRDPLSSDESFDYHIKEVTVRSMMGEFDGNAGLLTGQFNHVKKQWEWIFTLCPFAIQHFWWFSKVSALLTGFLWSLYLVL